MTFITLHADVKIETAKAILAMVYDVERKEVVEEIWIPKAFLKDVKFRAGAKKKFSLSKNTFLKFTKKPQNETQNLIDAYVKDQEEYMQREQAYKAAKAVKTEEFVEAVEDTTKKEEVETNFTEEKDPKFENLCDEIKKEIKEEHKTEEWLSGYPLENHNAFSFFVEYDERGFVSRCKVAFFEEHSYNIIYNENTENKKVAALFDTTHEEHDKEVRSVAKIVFKLKNKGQLTKEEQDAKLEEANTQRQIYIDELF